MDSEAKPNKEPWTRRIDKVLRSFDLSVQRFDHGTSVVKKLFHIKRHTLVSYLWPALVCTAVLTGMPVISGCRVVAAGIALVFASFALPWCARFTRKRGVACDAFAQCVAVLLCCGIVTVFGSDQVLEHGVFYLHALVPVAAIFALSIMGAAWITPACFLEHKRETSYPEAIKKTQLFQRSPQPLPGGWGTFLQGLFLALARVPELLFLPCLLMMVVPAKLVPWTAVTMVVPLVLLVVSGLDERVDQILHQLSNQFFRNGAVLVSATVIALGLARFFGVSYVATVLDTAAGSQIVIYLSYAYAMVFWQDYWITRLAGQEILGIVGGSKVGSKDVRIPYAFSDDNKHAEVPADGRWIQLHGLGRFLIGRNSSNDVGESYPTFHTWTFAELFAHVASHAHPGGDAKPSPHKIAHRLLQHATMVRLLTIVVLALGVWALSKLDQSAAVVASNAVPGKVKLAELIEQHPTDRPVILLAASGGGTRAALYTAAVLEGLSRKGVIGDLVLGSGVSGGGASLAYFAGRRNHLNCDEDWDEYFKVMQTAYIRDVLERSGEWRMLAERRLGTLLEESFERHWNLGDRVALGDVTDIGLVFNTTIAGHYAATQPGDLAAKASSQRNEATLAGGRLIITNLETENMFKGVNGPYGTDLPVVVHDPKFKLAAAAALNANFPPVFSNAPIDVDKQYRYWVTDGGAADNRGAEMLMYALRGTLREKPEFATNRRILVLIVDAGAAPGKYAQDRGIGSAIGAGTQFAMHLVAELARDVGDAVQLLYLPMPHALSESFGTHWMLQGTIRVGEDDLSGDSMVEILRGLYAKDDCTGVHDPAARNACNMTRGSKEMCDDWWKVASWIAASPQPRFKGCPAASQ